MSEEERPIATGLLTFHKVITRGLEVGIENARTFSQQGFPDDAIREGYQTYVQALGILLDGHHLSEDEVVFPHYRDKLPDVPFDLLTSQHRAMEPELERITLALGRIEGGDETALADLEAALVAIRELWHPHIQLEEQQLVGKVDELLPVDERFRFSGALTAYGQAHSQPSFLTVPFVLYNLAAEDRAVLAAGMPAELTEKLIPVVWKEKWAPMAPFFLP
jgi:hemerythrin-like domain-containing protein